jgi:hypothetical protein
VPSYDGRKVVNKLDVATEETVNAAQSCHQILMAIPVLIGMLSISKDLL